jgi:hypothetical protein
VARFGFVLALLVFALPTAAQARPEDGMGCPQGYVAFSAQTGQGGPPSYMPGDTVSASGYLTDAKSRGSRTVTLRWGSPQGTAVGQAALDAEGSFKGLSFVIPEGAPHRIYTLYLEARDSKGEMLPGLPIPTRLRVGPPPRPSRVTADEPETAVPRVGERRPQRSAPGPLRPSRATRSPEPAGPLPHLGRPRLNEQPGADRRAERRERPRPTGAGARRAEPASLRASTGAFVGQSSTGEFSAWVLALAALLGLLVARGIILRRRVAGRDRVEHQAAIMPPAESDAEASSQVIEAALQEMIAEGRARQAAERTPEVPRVG